MRLSRVFAGLAAAAAVGVVLAPSAMAAPASITPSHVTAGKVVKLSVTAPACSAPEIELSGPVIGGNVFLSHAGEPAHTFAGHVLVAASAPAGAHRLSLRCSGGAPRAEKAGFLMATLSDRPTFSERCRSSTSSGAVTTCGSCGRSGPESGPYLPRALRGCQ